MAKPMDDSLTLGHVGDETNSDRCINAESVLNANPHTNEFFGRGFVVSVALGLQKNCP